MERDQLVQDSLRRLMAEVDSPKRRVLRQRWVRSLLGRDHRPLRRETLAVEAIRLRQLSPQGRPRSCLICVCSSLTGA
jgi:hypothetical protein